mmetsp:Transcript_31469/g.73515  ORF Transcript_31469/g.73515 Transcript_31469/m.73515 type:complete len:722 (+) Transcript_31469:89-2254(+)
MKSTRCLPLLAVCLAASSSLAHALDVASPSPAAPASPQVQKVVTLLSQLQARVEQDGRLEQASYDKYSCWCEKTLERKAQDIANGKTEVERLQQLILKLEGELGSHKADIAQLKKDIGDNQKAQAEATEVREKAHAEFVDETTESQQCLGALDAAIKTLAGAGTGKFLETMQEAQLLSVAAGVRTALQSRLTADAVSDSDMQVVKQFVQKPSNFVGSKGMSAAQVGQNPFGDYAPQSTVIQGILKEMESNIQASLQKAMEDEAAEKKAYDELMATKAKELDTLQDTLQVQETAFAEKTKTNADSKMSRDDTIAQVKADEAFFAQTKEGCKNKAMEWAERCRLRTQELQGIAKGIAILSSDSSSAVFGRSYTTLVQLDSQAHGAVIREHSSHRKEKAVAHLRTLAARHQSTTLTALAAKLQNGGYFDKVIAMIDQTMEVLRQEEKDDIAQRDRCEQQGGKTSNSLEDLNHEIDRTQGEINRINDNMDEVKSNIAVLTEEIGNSKQQLADLLNLRNEEVMDFKQALKDDTDAVALMEQAITSIAAFYKKNKIPLELAQTGATDPVYFVDPDKPPETVWEGGNYGGRKSESTGIISIMSMIKEDIQNEMKVARAEDAEAQQDYEKSKAALETSLSKDKDSKVAAEKVLAELGAKLADKEEDRTHLRADWSEQKQLGATIGKECSWVKSHFDSRREKRKAEMAGLVDAKTYLQGVEDGTAEDDLE